MASANFIQTAYIAFFNRPADRPGFDYWNITMQDGPDEDPDLLDLFSQSAEYISDYAEFDLATSTGAMGAINKVYNNLFGRNAIFAVSDAQYWLDEILAGNVTLANMAWAILGGAQNEDYDAIQNKVAAAQAFTDALVTADEIAAYNDAGPNGVGGAAKAWLSTVDDSSGSLTDAINALPVLVQTLLDAASGTGPGPGVGDNVIWIGGDPTLVGTDGNDTFKALTGQLDDNTVIDGLAGNDTLDVTMRADSAIAPMVRNVEKVIVRAQDGNAGSPYVPGETDNNIYDYATIDADRFVGVHWWESSNSRADVKIEDVRILDSQITRDITIAFRDSDPGHVDFVVYFDQPSLRNVTTTSGIINCALVDNLGLDLQSLMLLDNPFDTIRFSVDGNMYEVNFGAVNGSATTEDLRDAIQAAIDATPGLATYNITVTLINAPFMVPPHGALQRDVGYYLQIESVGHELEGNSWIASGGVPGSGSYGTAMLSANPTSSELVTSTIILDNVGRGSMGGDLVVGGLSVGYTSGSLGVQRFNISVERDSKLEVISSTNNTLQEVYLVNSGTYDYLGAYQRGAHQGARSSDLTVWGATYDDTGAVKDYLFGPKDLGPYAGLEPHAVEANQAIDGAGAQQYNGYGFTDVRVIDASAFLGNVALNAYLSEDVVAKYLDRKDAAPGLAGADNRTFAYTLGSGNDRFDLALDYANLAASGTGTREDFVLNINAGAGHDVINVAVTADPDTPDLTIATDATPWYINQKFNANLTINAGTGNDTVSVYGSGDWTVILGSGNDTYYGAVDPGVEKALWIFNTADQDPAGATARALDGNGPTSSANDNRILVNDGYVGVANNGYDGATEMSGLFGLKLRVVFEDVSDSTNVLPSVNGNGVYFSQAVDVPTSGNNRFNVTDLNINQAIKAAINNDPVLSKLLVAEDGPANTLVVRALSDGTHVVDDLHIEFAIPDVNPTTSDRTAWLTAIGAHTDWTAADLQLGRIASFNNLLDNGVYSNAFNPALQSVYDDYGPNPLSGNTDGYSEWYSPNLAAVTYGDYTSGFGNIGGVDVAGGDSAHASDNVIIVDGSSGDHNVIVLGTGTLNNDTIKWEGFNNGTTTIVNFDAVAGAGMGNDILDFTSYGARWLGAATLDNLGFVAVAGTNWDMAGDLTASTAPGNVDGGTARATTASNLPTVVAAGTEVYWGDYELKSGDKYITLTRVDATHTTASDDWNTLYKIELWTVSGTHADAYLAAADVPAGDTRDTAQLIGYVDVGREIDLAGAGVYANDGILNQIDFIAGY